MKTTLFRVAFNCGHLYKTQWGLFILFLDFSDDELDDEMIKCRPCRCERRIQRRIGPRGLSGLLCLVVLFRRFNDPRFKIVSN